MFNLENRLKDIKQEKNVTMQILMFILADYNFD